MMGMTTATLINALGPAARRPVGPAGAQEAAAGTGRPHGRRQADLQDGIEEMFWVAALKPTNIGVPVFRDDVREYLEIAVLTVKLRAAAKPSRLVELIHRAVPYPVVLVTAHGDTVSLSLAHKRWSQGEKGKVVIEDVRRTAPFQPDAPTAEEAAFLASLALGQPARPRPVHGLPGLARPRGGAGGGPDHRHVCRRPSPPTAPAVLRDGLDAHARLQRDLAVLRAKAKKEKQINRRVELNLEIKRLEANALLKSPLICSCPRS